VKRSILLIAALAATVGASAIAQQDDIERGRYVARIGGCHDCHTAGYPQKAARCPKASGSPATWSAFAGPGAQAIRPTCG
jgi:hypothetical protein